MIEKFVNAVPQLVTPSHFPPIFVQRTTFNLIPSAIKVIGLSVPVPRSGTTHRKNKRNKAWIHN